jgi:hypothetical protein
MSTDGVNMQRISSHGQPAPRKARRFGQLNVRLLSSYQSHREEKGGIRSRLLLLYPLTISLLLHSPSTPMTASLRQPGWVLLFIQGISLPKVISAMGEEEEEEESG